MVDALKEAGNGPDDEAMKKALVFVSRCQNLESEYNTTPAAAKNPDGGFYYTPADGGDSEAGKLPNGGLRSYASMTYSGLKSMIYCGVKADDPARQGGHEVDPGELRSEDQPGHRAGRSLLLLPRLCQGPGGRRQRHAGGRQGREARLAERSSSRNWPPRQQANGSWINAKSPRWVEGDPNLVTGYVLLALSYCRPGRSRELRA